MKSAPDDKRDQYKPKLTQSICHSIRVSRPSEMSRLKARRIHLLREVARKAAVALISTEVLSLIEFNVIDPDE